MNQTRLIAVLSLLAMLAPGTSALLGQDAATSNQTVAIYHARHAPAAELSEAVNAFLQHAPAASAKEQPVIVPMPISNSLLVRGESTHVKRIHEVLKELDRKPPSVFVDVVIAMVASDTRPGRIEIRSDGRSTADDLLAALAEQGSLQVLARAQLTALHNQSAFLHFGERRPLGTRVQGSSSGRTSSVRMENVGLVLGVTPRVATDGTVTMELDLDRSNPANQGDVVELASAGERVADVATFSIQTTLCVEDGRTVVLGGLTEGVDGKWRKLLALLTPTVIE